MLSERLFPAPSAPDLRFLTSDSCFCYNKSERFTRRCPKRLSTPTTRPCTCNAPAETNSIPAPHTRAISTSKSAPTATRSLLASSVWLTPPVASSASAASSPSPTQQWQPQSNASSASKPPLRRRLFSLGLCDNACMAAIEVQHYLGRARDFASGMSLLQDDIGSYRYSSALLAIHSVIAYCDALRIGMGSKKLSSDDHLKAADHLKRLLAARKYELMNGPELYKKVVKLKNRIAYLNERVEGKHIAAVLDDSEKFALWAEAAGRKLRIEGWRNDPA